MSAYMSKSLLSSSIICKLRVQTCRCMCKSSDQNKLLKKPAAIGSPIPPEHVTRDWYGPPDKFSNIRAVKFYKPPDETRIEKEFREQREDAQAWHNEYWSQHNKNFFAKKEEFTKKKLAENNSNCLESEKKKTLSTDEMSEFYTKTLNDNYELHINYNKEWYKRNFSMVIPAIKVNFVKLWRHIRPRRRGRPRNIEQT